MGKMMRTRGESSVLLWVVYSTEVYGAMVS